MARSDETSGKSAAELEQEVEMQRGRVSDTIDQIQTRLSPGQIIDQLMGTTGAQDFASNFGRQVRENPLPVALLGASLLWLMSGKNPIGGGGSSRSDDFRGTDGLVHEPYYDDPMLAVGSGEHKGVVDKIKDAAGSIGDAAAGVGEKLAGVGDQLSGIKDKASRTAHDLRDNFESARHSVGHAAEKVTSQAKALGGHVSGMQDSVSQFLRDQPLVAGALAFAAGAALGAALPVTAKERELVGDAAAEVVSKVQEMAEPVVEKAKDLAGDAIEQGKDLLKETKDKVGEEYSSLKDNVASTLGASPDAGTEG